MFKKTFALTGLTFSIAANSAVVDFSAMTNQANYSGNSDFTVKTYGGPETDSNLSPHISGGRLLNSSDPADISNNYPTEDIIRFDFNSGIDALTLDMYWASDPGSESTGVTVSSFDKHGNLLQQFGYLDDLHAIYNFDSTEAIYALETDTNLLPSRGSWWYGINSISTTPVPVPAAAWLFGSALVGIVGVKRRKR